MAQRSHGHKRFGFLPEAAPDAETLAREADDASLSQFFWTQTTSCESIFLRQGLQTIIYALELMSLTLHSKGRLNHSF